MQKSQFNPFTDRVSRDIRNDLSTALTRCLQRGDIAPAEAVAHGYLMRRLDTCYVDYIEDRLRRYRQAVQAISTAPADPIHRALHLWDLELFFEVHEVLEHAWLQASGAEKLLLQALIRAAGMYIKLEYGFETQAGKMAARALPVLQEQRARLAEYFPPERLIDALQDGRESPPKLLVDAG